MGSVMDVAFVSKMIALNGCAVTHVIIGTA